MSHSGKSLEVGHKMKWAHILMRKSHSCLTLCGWNNQGVILKLALLIVATKKSLLENSNSYTFKAWGIHD